MDFTTYRPLFPVTQNWIYVNHAAVGPLSTRVQESVQQFIKESVEHGYTAAEKWHTLIAQARQNVAALINSEIDEVAFTASTSEGLSFVANGLQWNKGDNLLVPDCEFPANIYPWLDLEKQGVEVRRIPSKEGRISLEEIEKLADSKTRLLSTSSVQYGSGWATPLKQLGTWCRKNNILFCVDGIQSCGILPMDVKAFQIDFLAADAHKWLLGPEGIAFFYCSNRVVDQLSPSVIGWKSVENPLDFDHIDFTLKKGAQKFEAGSSNVLGIHALNATLELLLEVGIDSIQKQVLHLNQILVDQIQKEWPKTESLVPEKQEERSGIVALKVASDPVQLVSTFLKEKIYLASRRGWLRISPHFYNTEEEMEIIVHKGKKLL